MCVCVCVGKRTVDGANGLVVTIRRWAGLVWVGLWFWFWFCFCWIVGCVMDVCMCMCRMDGIWDCEYGCIVGAGRESRVRGISGWLIYLSTAVAQGCTSTGTFVPKPRFSEIVPSGLSRDDKRGGCAGVSSAAIVHECDSVGM